MRIFKTYVLCILMIVFLFTNALEAQEPVQDTLQTNKRIDSMLMALNLKPSAAELEWIKSNLQRRTLCEQSKDAAPWITAIVAIIGFFIQRYWQLRKDRVDKLYDSLRWFEGKTQSRSIGIAMVEANWKKEQRFRKTWYPVLANQAIYLLLQSGQNDAPHEISNLKRIMTLLKDNKDSFRKIFKQGFEQLAIALESRSEDGKPPEMKQKDKGEKEREQTKEEKKPQDKSTTVGLDLSKKTDNDDLREWKNIFGRSPT